MAAYPKTTGAKKSAHDQTKAGLAKIHIAKKELALTDEAYRDMLYFHFKVRSAKDLNQRQVTVLLNHLKARGWKPKRTAADPRPFGAKGQEPGLKKRLIAKIEAHLTIRKLPWSYAHAMAKRICKVERLEFCDEAGLRDIVTAFEYDSRRKGL